MPQALAWDWNTALLGTLYALPAGVVATGDVKLGIALEIGCLPAAIIGLLPTRGSRIAVIAVGVVAGLSVLLGGALAGVPVLAVAVIFALAVGAAAVARTRRLGQVALVLALPLVGVGLSYDDVGTAAELGALMAAGSVFACGVCLLWPERKDVRKRPAPTPVTIDYGIRLGVAAAIAASVGFLFDFDHVGWACAATLLVMRPAPEMQKLRSVGRVISVVVGALLAIALVRVRPDADIYALAVVAAISGAAATRSSRWYVTPAFTTFLVFLLLLYSEPGDAATRLGERMGETVLGVGLAYLFGLVLPMAQSRHALKTRSADA